MRAAWFTEYGPPEVVTLRDVPDPSAGQGEVRVRVEATPVTAADSRIRGARFPRGFAPFARAAFGVRRPRRHVLGGSYAGVVDAVGEGVTGIEEGDRVCGMTGARLGTHAELVLVPAGSVVPVPTEVSATDAAGVLFGGATAYHFLHRLGGVRAGHRVLVIGASGATGTAAVQLARAAGATVSAVCSASNAALVADLGAEEVVDYRSTDVTGLGARFDLVLDAVGTLTPRTGRALLAPDGRLLLVAADLWATLAAQAPGPARAGVSSERVEVIALLVDHVRDGSLRSVGERLPLDQVVAAHRIVDSGRKVGNLVLVP